MKNSLVIMKLTLRILFRKGTVLSLLGLICGLSTLVFYLSRGDGLLTNELEIRISYSYYMSYAILSLSTIALACFTIRSQIDAKNVHLLSSMPLDRKWIVAGQAMALMIVAGLAELILLGSLLVNSYVYSKSFTPEEKEQASKKYLLSHRKVSPLYKNKRDIARAYAEKREISVEGIGGIAWYRLTRKAMREQQLIEPGKSLSWEFDLGEQPEVGENGELSLRFQRADKREQVKGYFELSAEGYNLYFKKEIVANQYKHESFSIPLSSIPPNGRFVIKFTNTGQQASVVTRSGIYFSYQKGTLWSNLFKSFITQFIHLSVTVLVGICAGIGLSFSVATFMVMMLFVMSSSQGLFTVVMEGYGYMPVLDFWDKTGIFLLNSGMWMTKGLQPPDIVASMSSGLDVGLYELASNWLPSVVFYGIFAYILGTWLLSSKELDKVQK